MLGLQYFTFSELWKPFELAIAIGVAIVYLILAGPKRTLFVDSEPVPLKRKLLFLLGLALLYFAMSGPLSLLGHLMFSAHMAAMSIAYLVASPLLLLGLPAWMIRPLLKNKVVSKVFNGLTHPLIAVMAFNMLFSFYHIPEVHDYVMTHFMVHRIYFALLFITSLMMWWLIVVPVPERNHNMGELKKMAYIFANGVLITPACALIIFAQIPVFGTYSDPQMWAQAMGYCVPTNAQVLLSDFEGGPQFFALLSAQEDQQLGGVIMKIMQEIMYGAALAYIFFSWYFRERGDDEMPAGDASMEPKPVV